MEDVPVTGGARSSGKASGILARLAQIEAAQGRLLTDMEAKHGSEREALRAKIEAAQNRRRSLESSGSAAAASAALPPPVLMELDMKDIDAAVQAASAAERESAAALAEARKVAEDARVASGASSGTLAIKGSDTDGVSSGVGFGADSEFIVKQVQVNLDDVERVINNSPLVEVCRAFGRPDQKYGNEVYCCVVPKRNVRVSEPMLMLYAQKYLSTALCPKRFFFLESLPSGITRKELADTKMGEKSQKPALPSTGIH